MIGVVFMLVGVGLMIAQRIKEPEFFARKAETPTDEVARGEAIAEGSLIVEED